MAVLGQCAPHPLEPEAGFDAQASQSFEPESASDTQVQQETALSFEEGEQHTKVSEGVTLPPLPLAAFEQVSEYQRSATVESWRLVTSESCADYALRVLESLQAQDVELLEAGFMDLSGENWGCVFKGANDESFSIVLMPERPFSPRSETNLLVVNVLHYLVPEDVL